MIVISPNKHTKLQTLNWKFENPALSLDRVTKFQFQCLQKLSHDYFLFLYLCQNWTLSHNKTKSCIIASGLLKTHNLSQWVSHFYWKILKSLKNWESSYQMLPERYMASLRNQMKILCRLSKWKILVSTWPLENCLSVIHPDWSKNRKTNTINLKS